MFGPVPLAYSYLWPLVIPSCRSSIKLWEEGNYCFFLATTHESPNLMTDRSFLLLKSMTPITIAMPTN